MSSRQAAFGIGVLVVATLTIPTIWLARRAVGKNQHEQTLPRPLPVHTVRAEAVSSFRTARDYTGTIVAARESAVAFERAGKVIKIVVDQGERVEAGQELARLDERHLLADRRRLEANLQEATARLDELIAGPRKEQIAAAEADVRNLVAQKQLQELNLKRRESLLKTSAIVQEEYDSARFGLDALTSQLDAAQQQLNELKAGTRPEQIAAARAAVAQLEASIAANEHDLEDCVLHAPFAGTVAERFIDEGAVITPQSPVARIVEDSQLEAWVGLPVETAQRLSLDQPVTLLSASGQIVGTVKAVLPELDVATRTRRVVVNVPDSTDLLPGQIVRLEVSEETTATGIRLPTSALVSASRGLWSCYAVVPDDAGQQRVERRDVEVLHTSGEDVIVRGTVEPGEAIVASGAHRVAHGQLVKVVTAPAKEREIGQGKFSCETSQTFSWAARTVSIEGRG